MTDFVFAHKNKAKPFDISHHVHSSEHTLLSTLRKFRSKKMCLYFKFYHCKNNHSACPRKVKQCVEASVDDEVPYILATWENIFYLGSHDQRVHFNELRKKYMNALLSHVETYGCKSDAVCKLDIVGSVNVNGKARIVDISPASDLDINITYTLDRGMSANIIKHSLKAPVNFHSQYFMLPLSKLFDVNFYGSAWKPNQRDDQMMESNHEQHVWAALRLCDVLRKSKMINLAKKRFEDTNLINILKDGFRKSKAFEQHSQNEMAYSRILAKFFRTHDIDKQMKYFSQAKAYEHESYRSLGAFLHIVEKRRDMHLSFYVDSVLDNLGFLIENIWMSTPCSQIRYEYKIMRAAKYLERVCDGLELLLSDKHKIPVVIKRVKSISNEINMLRKAMGYNEGMYNNPRFVRLVNKWLDVFDLSPTDASPQKMTLKVLDFVFGIMSSS